MPLLEIPQVRQITATIRLDELTASQIDQYAAFLHASADEVVDKALAYVFAKDRDFQEFLKSPKGRAGSAELAYPPRSAERRGIETCFAYCAGRQGDGNGQRPEPPRRCRMTAAISAREKAALERLIQIAQSDTGQSRMTAEFLLSWWNAANCGGFDLTTMWGVDTEIAADMVTVFGLVACCHRYPDDLGYGEEFRRIVRAWRPALKHG